MRVSSLSNARVQQLIATYFVPVWHSRDSYQLAEPSREEQAELGRIDRDRDRRGLPGGTVCVFLLKPDGSVAASLPVQQAYQPEKLAPFLEKFIADQQLQPRDRAAVQASRSSGRATRPKSPAGGLVLHTWARYEARDPNRGTSQDWVTWNAAELAIILGAPENYEKAWWALPSAAAESLAARCYPPGPYWNVRDAKVVSAQLKATLISKAAQEVRVRLGGDLELIHPNEGKETDRHVKARLLGYVRYNLRTMAITSFVLASEEAASLWHWRGRPQVNRMQFAATMER
jgi:hypothetical protein